MTGRILVMLLKKVSTLLGRQLGTKKTNRTRSMQHADTEIPQEKSAVVTDATKSIRLLITAPWIERDGRNEGIMSLAASDNFAFGERPDSEKVVLTTSHDVFSVG